MPTEGGTQDVGGGGGRLHFSFSRPFSVWGDQRQIPDDDR